MTQTSLKITKVLRSFNKTSASVLFLELYFELRNIYNRIPNLIIAIVLNSENNFIIARLTVWVWCGVAIMNGQIVYVFTDVC